MKKYFPLYVSVLRFAIICGLAYGTARAAPSNSDEAALGAAAIIVLAQKCVPGQTIYYQREAHNHLLFMLQRFSESARAQIVDDIRMKVKAFEMSSSAESCADAVRLHSMATWGYDYIVQTMPRP